MMAGWFPVSHSLLLFSASYLCYSNESPSPLCSMLASFFQLCLAPVFGRLFPFSNNSPYFLFLLLVSSGLPKQLTHQLFLFHFSSPLATQNSSLVGWSEKKNKNPSIQGGLQKGIHIYTTLETFSYIQYEIWQILSHADTTSSLFSWDEMAKQTNPSWG